MKRIDGRWLSIAFFVTVMLAAAPAARPGDAGVPDGWIKAGDAPTKYEVGVDHAVSHGGHASGYIRSLVSVTGGFGTLMQECAAASYEGKRVRMSAWVMSAEVGDWAGLWLRVDGERRRDQTDPAIPVLGFDNMQSRPIKGSTAWKRYEIVLDVPSGAQDLAYGVLLSGAGEAWIDDVRFDVVDRSVPVTGKALGPISHEAPSNLDFER